MAVDHGRQPPIEAGGRGSLGTYSRLAVVFGLSLSFTIDSRRSPGIVRDADSVYAAMGEAEATHFRARGVEVLLDEP